MFFCLHLASDGLPGDKPDRTATAAGSFETINSTQLLCLKRAFPFIATERRCSASSFQSGESQTQDLQIERKSWNLVIGWTSSCAPSIITPLSLDGPGILVAVKSTAASRQLCYSELLVLPAAPVAAGSPASLLPLRPRECHSMCKRPWQNACFAIAQLTTCKLPRSPTRAEIWDSHQVSPHPNLSTTPAASP